MDWRWVCSQLLWVTSREPQMWFTVGSHVPKDLSPVMQWSGTGISQLTSQKPSTEVQTSVSVNDAGGAASQVTSASKALESLYAVTAGYSSREMSKRRSSRNCSWSEVLYTADACESCETQRWYSEAPRAARALGTPCWGRTFMFAIISMPLSLEAAISWKWVFWEARTFSMPVGPPSAAMLLPRRPATASIAAPPRAATTILARP
mmetsp:Transcript_10451/g.29221  ORF Transcript_10451/g.29221 Transcript_10451/m.29221 type:complete len:206 (-) Transcript_10451:230-847(-)